MTMKMHGICRQLHLAARDQAANGIAAQFDRQLPDSAPRTGKRLGEIRFSAVGDHGKRREAIAVAP
jgi:hypothetical protein